MAVNVGAVYVDVRPSTDNFVRRMEKDLLDQSNELGEKLGRQFGESIGREVADSVGTGVSRGLRRVGRDAERAGRDAGGAFARRFRAQVESALRNLPDVKIGVDTSVTAAVQAARAALASLSDKTIGINLPAADALRQIQAVRAALLSLRDRTVTVEMRTDIDGALKDLDAAERDLADRGERSAGAFADNYRNTLRRALGELPTIDQDVVVSLDGEELAGLRGEIEAVLGRTDVEIGADPDRAIRDVARLRVALESLRDTTVDLKVRDEIDQALKPLRAYQERIDALSSSSERAQRDLFDLDDVIRRSLNESLADLREVKIGIDGNTDPLKRELREIGFEISRLRRIEIGVDLSDVQALANIERLTARLTALRDLSPSVEVKAAITRALADLAKVDVAAAKLENREAEIKVEADVGAFEAKVRAAVAAATKAIPEIQIDGDTDRFDLTLASARARLLALNDVKIGIDLSADEFVAELINIRALLDSIGDEDVRVDVEIITAAATAALDKLTRSRDVEIRPEVGAFETKVRAAIAKATKSIPDIKIDGDSSPIDIKLASLKGRLEALKDVRIGIDLTTKEFVAEVAIVERELAKIARKRVDIQVRTDAKGAAAELAAVGAAATAAGNAGHASFNRMRLMIAALIVLFPLLAAGVVALPALLSLIVAPIAAIALGADGIKAAFAPLAPQFRELRSEVSATFEQGLKPAVENISKIVPTLTDGLVGTAAALSEVTAQVTAVYSSSRNLPIIADSFTRLNGVIVSLGPSLAALNQNLIDLVNIGAQGLVGLGAQMTVVGETWTRVIGTLASTGVGAQAVDALVQVFAALLNLMAPLTLLGAELAAALGPALAGALNVVAGVVEALATALGFLGNTFGVAGEVASTFIAAIVTAGLVMRVFGLGAATATFSLAGFGAALFGAGAAVRGFAIALAGLLLNPVALAIGAIAVVLSIFASNSADAAAKSAELQQEASALATALRDSGGAMTAQVRQTEILALANTEAKDSAAQLGLSLGTLVDITFRGGAAYDGLVASLESTAAAGDAAANSFNAHAFASEGARQSVIAQGEAASTLLPIIEQQREKYRLAALEQEAYRIAIESSGVSMVNGAASAESLIAAFSTLSSEMSTVTEKADALATALTLLVGGSLSAEQASAALKDTMADIGEQFTAAKDAAAAAGIGILDAGGAINQTTAEGRALVQGISEITTSMATAATSAFEAAGGIGNLAASVPAATAQVESARAGFLEFADAAGFSAEAANRYADQLGLIPSLVVTLLKAEGVPKAAQELTQLAGQLDAVAPGVSIPVKALTAEALAVLDELNIRVETLADGTLSVTATDETPPVISQILARIFGEEAMLGTGLDPAGAAADLPVVQGIVEGSTPAAVPTTLDPAGVQASAPGVRAGVANGPPAELPVVTNNAGVAPGVAEARAVVGAVDAQLPITPNYLGLSLSLNAIRTQIATPVVMPVTVNLLAASLAISAIQTQARTPVVLGVTANTAVAAAQITTLIAPRTVTISVSANTAAALGQINTLTVARTVMITVTANTAAALGQLNTLTVARQMTVTAVANTAAAVGALNTMAVNRTSTLTVIFTSVGSAQAAYNALAQAKSATFTVIFVTIAGAQTAYNALAQPKSAVFTLIFPTIAAAQTAYNNLAQPKGATFTVTTNLSAAQTAYDNLARNRSSTLTVNIATNGSVPTVPNAMGNILPANLRAFANGGFSPMAAGKARIVKPNTFRLIGDRSKDDEAYIPINQSKRSQALLETTAQRMGRTLLPMAMGGVLGNGAADALTRLATTLDKQRISTQTASAFGASPLSNPAAGAGRPGGVEAKLDEVIAALRERKQTSPITVEDRSGNPMETARAVQLAQRLAR